MNTIATISVLALFAMLLPNALAVSCETPVLYSIEGCLESENYPDCLQETYEIQQVKDCYENPGEVPEFGTVAAALALAGAGAIAYKRRK